MPPFESFESFEDLERRIEDIRFEDPDNQISTAFTNPSKQKLTQTDVVDYLRFYERVIAGSYFPDLRREFRETKLEAFTNATGDVWKWSNRVKVLNTFVEQYIIPESNVLASEDKPAIENYNMLINGIVNLQNKAVNKVEKARYRIANKNTVLTSLKDLANRLSRRKIASEHLVPLETNMLQVRALYDFRGIMNRFIKNKSPRETQMLEHPAMGNEQPAARQYTPTNVEEEVKTWLTTARSKENPFAYVTERYRAALAALSEGKEQTTVGRWYCKALREHGNQAELLLLEQRNKQKGYRPVEDYSPEKVIEDAANDTRYITATSLSGGQGNRRHKNLLTRLGGAILAGFITISITGAASAYFSKEDAKKCYTREDFTAKGAILEVKTHDGTYHHIGEGLLYQKKCPTNP